MTNPTYSDQQLQQMGITPDNQFSDDDLRSMGITPDIGGAASQLGSLGLQFASNPTSGLTNLFTNILNPSTVGKGLAEGAAAVPYGLWNLVSKIPGASSIGISKTSAPQFLSSQEETSPTGQVSKILGTLGATAPAAMIPGALPALLGEEIPGGALLAARIATAVPIQGTIGAALTPNHPLLGGTIGAAGGALGEALTGLPSAIQSLFSGTRSPEQIQQIASAIPAGINMPIGDITGSPSANLMYKTAKIMPFSGAAKPYTQMNNYLQNAAKILAPDEAIARGGENPNQYVFDEMSNQYENAKDNTQQAYSNYAQAADQNNIPFQRSNLDNYINNELTSFKSKMTTDAAKQLYSPLVNLLQGFKEAPLNNFSDATNQLPVLNDLLTNASSSNDRLMMRTVTGLKQSLNNSLDDSAQQDPTLLDLYNQARQARIAQGQFENLDYKTQTPFFKIYSKNGSPSNLISQYIKPSTGTNDYSGILQNFVNTAPQDAVETAKSAYLNPNNLTGMISNLKNLSPTQKTLLFGDQTPLANQFQLLSQTFKGAGSPSFVPETGYAGAHAVGLAALIEAVREAGKEGLKSAVGTALGLPLVGQALQRGLRNPSLLDLMTQQNPSQLNTLPYFSQAPLAIGTNIDNSR